MFLILFFKFSEAKFIVIKNTTMSSHLVQCRQGYSGEEEDKTVNATYFLAPL